MNVTGTGTDGADGSLVALLRARGFEHATPDDDLLDLGLTSLQILQLAADITRELGTAVDVSTLLAPLTVGELEQQLAGGKPGS